MNVEGFTHRIVLGRRRQDARSHRRQRPRARPDPRFSADLVGVAPHDAAACQSAHGRRCRPQGCRAFRQAAGRVRQGKPRCRRPRRHDGVDVDKYAVCGHDIGAGARPDAPRCRHALDGARRVSARLEPVDGELARAEGLAVRLPHEARPAGAAHPRANSITSQPLSTTGPAIWSASGRGHRGIRAVPQAARKLEGRA